MFLWHILTGRIWWHQGSWWTWESSVYRPGQAYTDLIRITMEARAKEAMGHG